MTVQFARPDVASLVVRVYDRLVHPEFFDCHGLTVLECGNCRVHLRLCSAGHSWSLRRGKLVLTEAITRQDQPLPELRCLVEQKVSGCRTRSAQLAGGARYDISCQLETLAPDLFFRMHDELRADCAQADLAHEFPCANRFSPGALSVLSAVINRHSVMLHTYHTFPDHFAILKTQTLVECR
jgi:hypothetical protein